MWLFDNYGFPFFYFVKANLHNIYNYGEFGKWTKVKIILLQSNQLQAKLKNIV